MSQSAKTSAATPAADQTARLSANAMIAALLIAVAFVIAIAAPFGLSGEQAQMLAIILVTLSLWATQVVPGYLASMIFFSFVLVMQLAAPDRLFAGFGSTAVWLIVSGFVIGAAISVSGLGDRLAKLLGPSLTGSYTRLIGGLMLASMLLGFLMPSSVGRAAVLVPIGMALADRVGFAPGSKGRIGIALILAIGTNNPSFAILPSNIPNMILSGASETIHGVHFGYMEYLLLHYPVLGIVKAAVTVLIVLKLFPAETGAPLAAPEKAAATRKADKGAQIRVGIILAATLAMWMTDSLHGINSAWVGLVAASLLLLPRVGVVTPPVFKSSADFGMLMFVVGALAVGSMVNSSGLGTMFGDLLESVLPLQAGADFINFMSLSVMAMLTGLFTTIPGVPAVLTPMAGDLAAQTGIDLRTVLMTQVIGFSSPLFPYQLTPLIVAMQLSGERVGHVPRVILPLAAVTLVVLLPLDFLWWQLIGWL